MARTWAVSAAAVAAALCALVASGCPQPVLQDPDAAVDAGSGTGAGDGGGGADASIEPDGGSVDACVPITCAQQSGACGEVGNGCGGALTCECGVARTCSVTSGAGTCGCPSTGFRSRVAATGAGYTGLYNSIAVDKAGGVHAAYVEGDEGFRYLYQPPRESNFAPVVETVDAEKPVTGTAIAVDDSGVVHVVYYRWSAVSSSIWDAEVWYARRMPGEGWSRARVVTAGQMVYARADYAAIAVERGGTVHLLYYTFTYQTADLWHASSDTGSGWTTNLVAAGTEIGSTWSAAGTVSLLAEGSGALHALFFDYATFSLRYAVRPSGGAWSLEPEAVAAPSASGQWAGYFSSMARGPDNALHVTYSVEQSNSSALWHASRTLQGTWSAAQVPTGTATAGLYNALVSDAEGALHVLHYDSAAKDLRYAHRPSGGGWTDEAAETQGSVGSHAALAVDAEGSLHGLHFELVSSSNRTGQLRYVTRCR